MVSFAVLAVAAYFSTSIYHLLGVAGAAILALLYLRNKEDEPVAKEILWISIWTATAAATHWFLTPIQLWRKPIAILMSGMFIASLLLIVRSRRRQPRQ